MEAELRVFFFFFNDSKKACNKTLATSYDSGSVIITVVAVTGTLALLI